MSGCFSFRSLQISGIVSIDFRLIFGELKFVQASLDLQGGVHFANLTDIHAGVDLEGVEPGNAGLHELVNQLHAVSIGVNRDGSHPVGRQVITRL